MPPCAGLESAAPGSARQQDLILVPVPAASSSGSSGGPTETCLGWLDACLAQLQQRPGYATHVITVLLVALEGGAALLPPPGGVPLRAAGDAQVGLPPHLHAAPLLQVLR